MCQSSLRSEHQHNSFGQTVKNNAVTFPILEPAIKEKSVKVDKLVQCNIEISLQLSNGNTCLARDKKGCPLFASLLTYTSAPDEVLVDYRRVPVFSKLKH